MRHTEELSVNVNAVIESIGRQIEEFGLPSGAAETSYSVVDGFRDGQKRKTLEFSISIKQSSYRPLDASGRKSLGSRIRSCLPGSRHHGSFVFEDSGVVVMKTRKSSFDSPMAIIVDIVNDEPGRPTEVVPGEMFPEVRGHATAPLDALFGLYSGERDAIGCNEGTFTVSAVLCALVADYIWRTCETPILPIDFDDRSALIKNVSSLAGKVSPAHMIRAKSWVATLRFAVVFERYEKIAVERRKWVAEHGNYRSEHGGTSFSLPEGGPPSPPSGETVRRLAAACAQALDGFSSFRTPEAALSWDLQSLNTLKELHAMSMGFLIDQQPALHKRFESFRTASRRGQRLLASATWPL
jgi:hypothetical protein